jgi:hypothetical protein
MPNTSTRLGANRTGAELIPPENAFTAQRAPDGVPPDGEAAAQVRAEYVLEADPLGSVPLPLTVKGIVQTGLAKLVDRNPEVVVDKIGQRLAFERAGVRLYEAFLVKCRVNPGQGAFIPLDQVHDICVGEGRHFKMLSQALVALGADPTAQTPCADAAAVASIGVMQLVSDPRTTTAQCLEGLLMMELADKAGWELLITLAQHSGHYEAAEQFAVALEEEQVHLSRVSSWLESSVLASLNGPAV